MRIKAIRLVGIRCFEDTGEIELSPFCNVFVGKNNAGKSTVLKSVLALQGFRFFATDRRSGSTLAYSNICIERVSPQNKFLVTTAPPSGEIVVRQFVSEGTRLSVELKQNQSAIYLSRDEFFFPNIRPQHFLVPFLAKRKAMGFDENVAENRQTPLNGTLQNLYARIDRLVTAGHPRHATFQSALNEIVGLPITTRPSQNGKQAGMYLTDDEESFITLEQMGDGVSEMVALIVELCLERGKVFVLEEPETNLHPAALKALLGMIRSASEDNQFLIATHSNIVLRDLGYDERNEIINVYRNGDERLSPSQVEIVARDPSVHIELLKELGYEFADLDLHDAWLFLEESSAEQIFNEVLIPMYFSNLKGRVRTIAVGGVSKLEPTVTEFQRLVVFVHLQPVYKGRIWIRVDGDKDGSAIVLGLRKKFPYLTNNTCASFSEASFEKYYPRQFAKCVAAVLGIEDKKQRQVEKTSLLLEVIRWSKANTEEAKLAWEQSASEPIDLLRSIARMTERKK